MAPRRPPKKNSNTRDAAAIDAMGQYGFHIDIIKETIKELLNVYGEEGWIFIEDSAYKVLLEAILEKVVKETGEGTSGSRKPAAETSSGTALKKVLACSNVNPVNTESQIFNGVDCALEANESLWPLQLTNEPGMHLPPVVADVQYPCGSSNFSPPPRYNSPPLHAKAPPPSFNSPQQGSNSTVKAQPPSHDSPPPQSSNSKAKAPRPSHNSPPSPQTSNSMEKAPPPSHGSPPPQCSNSKEKASPPSHDSRPPQASSPTTRRGRPYYGWVCSDDEEDLVELTPGTLAVEMEKYLLGFVERKKRWDIKPDDM